MIGASRVSPQLRLLIIALFCLLGCVVCLKYLSVTPERSRPWQLQDAWWTPVMALITVIVGIIVARTSVAIIAARATEYLGVARVRSAQSIISVVLYVLLALTVASQTQIDLSGIALSGAVTGVIVGIAAQASIANVVAGIVILFSRPFRSGQFVTVRAAAFAGSEYSGEVGEITLFYTTIFSGKQEIRVPNSAMVTSVVTLRPQVLDVYLPVILSPAKWGMLSSTELTRQLASALPHGRFVMASLERIDGGALQIGIHASVANESERATLENAVVKVLGPAPEANATGPDDDFA
jgi:small conductance mechanosensitive channel